MGLPGRVPTVAWVSRPMFSLCRSRLGRAVPLLRNPCHGLRFIAGPYPRPIEQSGPGRILKDIPDRMREIRCITYQVVVVLGLPEFACAHQAPVNFPAGESFPTLQYRSQGVDAEWLHDGMHVVGHHTPSVQCVALVVEMPQRVGNN